MIMSTMEEKSNDGKVHYREHGAMKAAKHLGNWDTLSPCSATIHNKAFLFSKRSSFYFSLLTLMLSAVNDY